MARSRTRSRSAVELHPTAESESAVQLGRIARVIALASVKDQKQKDQIGFLSGAGFSSSEIATMLGTTSAVVSQVLYVLRKEGRKRKKQAED